MCVHVDIATHMSPKVPETCDVSRRDFQSCRSRNGEQGSVCQCARENKFAHRQSTVCWPILENESPEAHAKNHKRFIQRCTTALPTVTSCVISKSPSEESRSNLELDYWHLHQAKFSLTCQTLLPLAAVSVQSRWFVCHIRWLSNKQFL